MSHAAALTALHGSLPGTLASALEALHAVHAVDDRAAMAGSTRETAAEAEDARDIEAVLGGDGGAYAHLVRRHQDGVSRMMHRFSRDRDVREQLVQDVFVEAWRSLSGYRAEAPFPHWLRRIATRVGYQYWREQTRQRARGATSDDDPLEDVATDVDPSGPREAAEIVHGLLALLPPRDRLVLTLVHLQGLGTQEVSELTGWSRTLVKVAAFRARKRLGALLRNRGYA